MPGLASIISTSNRNRRHPFFSETVYLFFSPAGPSRIELRTIFARALSSIYPAVTQEAGFFLPLGARWIPNLPGTVPSFWGERKHRLRSHPLDLPFLNYPEGYPAQNTALPGLGL